MKLRIKNNSVRLRLDQDDIRRFEEEGHVEGVTPFAGVQSLTYALRAASDVDRLSARFDGRTVSVRIPQAWASDWLVSDQVGFEGVERLEDGRELHLLVEKDFKCLHRRGDDDKHSFPHPAADAAYENA